MQSGRYDSWLTGARPDGMLLPPLCTQNGYVKAATDAGFEILAAPKDISKDVSKTW